MRLVLDSDVLVNALRVPKNGMLLSLHDKASQIFESCIAGEGIEKLLQVSTEIYPFTTDPYLNSLYSLSSNLYFQKCLANSSKFGKIVKNPDDKSVPGWNKSKTEVLLGGMDVFVISYAELKNAKLLTNDWSLWYAAWKMGLASYWLTGLTIEQVSDISNGLTVKYL